MKRQAFRLFFVIICVSMMMCSYVIPAIADEFDYSAMSDNEIVALLEKVNLEVVERGIQKTAKLAKGSYIAGKDIPVGSYIFTCLATENDWGNVTVYSDGGTGKQLLWEVVKATADGEEAETIFMTLHEGDQLKSGVAFSLTIAVGVLFQ